MNDLELDLTGAADAFDLPPGDVQAIVARGQTRGRRRQRIVAGAAAVAVVGSSVAGLRLLAAGDPTTTLAAGGSAMRLDEGAVSWETVDPSSMLSLVQQNPTTTSSSGRLYALSTAPGEADLGQPQAKVVWQSDDGVDWAATPLSDDIFLADLATSDERIYAVGTGPATAEVGGGAAVPDLVVGWSDDGAGTWQTATLPIDMAAIAEASRSVAINPDELTIASSSDATVAVASIGADLDVPRFLPTGVSAPNGWAITPDGVDLLGPAPGSCPEGTAIEEGHDAAPAGPPGRVSGGQCADDGSGRFLTAQELRGVTESYTWDELGVTGDLRRAALGRPMAFVAPAGSTEFEAIDLGLDGLGGYGASLHADDRGFVLITPSSVVETERATVLTSIDGRSWSAPDSLPGGLGWVTTAGRVGDTFVVLGQSASGEGMIVTDDGAGWQSVALADLLGIVGEGGGVNLAGAAVGPEGIVVAAAAFDDGGEGVEFHLLTSGDVTTWSAKSVSDLIDEPVSTIGQPVITGDQAVVPVAPIRPRGPDGHLQQVALVTTLP